MKDNFINVEEYLVAKGIVFWKKDNELIAKCIFSDCDRDSRDKEGHLYFNQTTGQYKCFKCGATGNLVSLAKHFGDPPSAVFEKPVEKQPAKMGAKLVDYCHRNMPLKIRKYLNDRGIPDGLIAKHKLGYGHFKNENWITIPIFGADGNVLFFKLRQDPNTGNQKLTWPKGVSMQLFNAEVIKEGIDHLLICEGELDCLIAESYGFNAVTSTHGANSFQPGWLESVRKDLPIYLCFDNDVTGSIAAIKHAGALYQAGFRNINIITLPSEVGDKGDLTDYFVKLKGAPGALVQELSTPYPPRIDTSKFREMGFDEIARVLDSTIIEEDTNKVLTFLAMLSAYSPDSQLNISFNAPSSSGKTYITQEVSRLFPPENVMKLAKVTATAFFHDAGEYDPDTNTYTVEFHKKILIFLDQPNQDLMTRMRPLLSHDDKALTSKITDKAEHYGLRAKNVVFQGFPAVIYCTAGQMMDEQEATRFIILSPDIDEARLKKSIAMTLDRQGDTVGFLSKVESDPNRILLKDRIRAIQQLDVKEIRIPTEKLAQIKEKFISNRKLKPRDQRDCARLLYIAKIFALLNYWLREKEGDAVVVSDFDIEQAFNIWKRISASQDLAVAPFILNLFKDVILPLYKMQNNGDFKELVGLTRQEVVVEYSRRSGCNISETKLRQDILPPLEEAGLIYQQYDAENSRKKLIFVREEYTCESGCVVKNENFKEKESEHDIEFEFPPIVGREADSGSPEVTGEHNLLLGQPEEDSILKGEWAVDVRPEKDTVLVG